MNLLRGFKVCVVAFWASLPAGVFAEVQNQSETTQSALPNADIAPFDPLRRLPGEMSEKASSEPARIQNTNIQYKQEQQDKDWVLLETRVIPRSCRQPETCLSQATPIIRNLAHLSLSEQRQIYLFLDRISAVRGVAAVKANALNLSQADWIEAVHKLPVSDKFQVLSDHPGVYFDSEKLDANPDTEGFSAYVRTQLEGLGVRFLTEEEWGATPGRPKLSLRFSPRRESEGCIVPFSASLTLTEDIVLARNPGQKISTSVWSSTARQNLANLNYQPESALREVVGRFLHDWAAAQEN